MLNCLSIGMPPAENLDHQTLRCRCQKATQKLTELIERVANIFDRNEWN